MKARHINFGDLQNLSESEGFEMVDSIIEGDITNFWIDAEVTSPLVVAVFLKCFTQRNAERLRAGTSIRSMTLTITTKDGLKTMRW